MKLSKFLSVLMMICVLVTVIAICPAASGANAEKHTITFDVQGIGETPAPITVNDGDRYLYLRDNDHGQNPTADGYVFHCWVTTLDFYPDEVEMSNTAAYLETPIHEDMTLYAIWYKIVDEIDITADVPVAGDVIGTERYETPDFTMDYQSPRPHAEVHSEGARIKDSFWSAIGPAVFWLEDPNDLESVFKGTFELGKEYGVVADVEPIFGYEFADTVSVTFNGELLSAEYPADHNLCVVSAPVICVEERLLGDVDGDGYISIIDAAFIRRKIAEIDVPFIFNDAASDFDGDGEVTVADATAIQYYLAEIKAS